jgi:hypothetical protein
MIVFTYFGLRSLKSSHVYELRFAISIYSSSYLLYHKMIQPETAPCETTSAEVSTPFLLIFVYRPHFDVFPDY